MKPTESARGVPGKSSSIAITDEAQLSKTDSILETATTEAYARYIQNGGDAATAKGIISDKYEGIADMVNLASSWVDLAGGDGDALVDQAVKKLLLSSFSVTRADAAFTASTQSDEPPPAFLDELNRSATWKPVIQEMKEKHKSSALFYHLRQRDGMTDADAAHLATPESFVAGFVQLIESLVSRQNVKAEDLYKFYDVAKRRATYDETTLAVSLRLLAEVALKVEDRHMKDLLRRCAQEIRLYAKQAMVQVANHNEQVALQFTTRLAMIFDAHSTGVPIPKGLLSAICTIVSTDQSKVKRDIGVNKEEVDMVTRVYAPLCAEDDVMDVDAPVVSNSQRAAYIDMLCHPEIFSPMIEKLFVQSVRAPNEPPGRKAPVDTNLRNCLCLLLALATVRISQQCIPTSLTPDESSTKQTLTGTSAEKKAMRDLNQTLRDCVQVCEDLHPGCWSRQFVKGTGVQTLRDGIDTSPVIGKGVVLWAREGLLKDVDPSKLVKTAIHYLELLELVADRHAALRNDTMMVFADAYGFQLWAKNDVNRRLDIEEKLRTLYGKGFISLFRMRQATSVTKLYRERFAGDDAIDKSYLRTFVADVMNTIAPTYSAPFAAELLELVAHKRIMDAVKANTTLCGQILEFVECVKSYSKLDQGVIQRVIQAYSTQ